MQYANEKQEELKREIESRFSELSAPYNRLVGAMCPVGILVFESPEVSGAGCEHVVVIDGDVFNIWEDWHFGALRATIKGNGKTYVRLQERGEDEEFGVVEDYAFRECKLPEKIMEVFSFMN